MKHQLGLCIAVLATASLAFAGGEEEKKKKAKGELGSLAAKTTTSTPQGGGWSGGPGHLRYSSGDEFNLNFKNYIQLGWAYRANDEGEEDHNDFDVRRARTVLSGNAYCPELTFKVQMEWAGAPAPIKDAWVNLRFHETDTYSISGQLGQMKPRHGREFNSSANQLMFIDRAYATMSFSNTRSQGAMLIGRGMEDQLTWSVGAFNGDVSALRTGNSEDSSPDEGDEENSYYIDVSWASADNVGMGTAQADLANTEELAFAGGAGYALINAIAPGNGMDVEVTSLNLWAEAKCNGFTGAAEYFMRSESPDTVGAADSDSAGFQLAGNWVAPEEEEGGNRMGFGARVSHVDLEDTNGGAGQLGVSTGKSVRDGAGTATFDIGTQLVVEVNFTLFHSGDENFKSQVGVWMESLNPDLPATAQDEDNFGIGYQNTLTF